MAAATPLPSESSDLRRLRQQVEDLEQALESIRSGAVDGVVVNDSGRVDLYTRTTAERPYQVLLDRMGAGLATVSPEGRILYANQRLAQWLRYDPSSLIGMPLGDLVLPGDRRKLVTQLRTTTGESNAFSPIFKRSDGATLPLLASVCSLEIQGHPVRCLVGIACGYEHLATQRRGLLNLNPGKRWQWRLPWLVPAASGLLLALLGGHRGIHPGHWEFWLALLVLGALTGTCAVVAREFQQQARSHAALNLEYQLVAENASDVVFRANLDGVTEWISATVKPLLGWDQGDLIGRPFKGFVHPDDLSLLLQADAAFNRGEVMHFRLRVLRREGSYHWVDVTARGTRDAQGRVIGIVGSWRDIQAEVDNDQANAQATTRLAAAMDSLIDPHVVLQASRDESGAIVDFIYVAANQAACRYMLLSSDQLIGRSVLELLPGHRSSGLLAMYIQALETGQPVLLNDFVYPHEILAEERHFDVRGVPQGEEISFTWRDVTERYQAAQELLASEEAYRLLAMNSSDVVIRVRDGRAIWISPSLKTSFGWDPEEWREEPFTGQVNPDDRATCEQAIEAASRNETRTTRLRVGARDGRWHWVRMRSSPYVDATGHTDGVVLTLGIIDTEVTAEQQLQQLAATDSLTGLLNRREVLSRLEAPAMPMRRSGQLTAALFCDLDKFKTINDRYGHGVGDELLRAVAERVRSCLRANDLAARLGGDELLVVLQGVRDLDNAVAIAEKIRETVLAPIPTSAGDVGITLSIGVTLLQPFESCDALIDRADTAMYEAKRAGRNRVIPMPA